MRNSHQTELDDINNFYDVLNESQLFITNIISAEEIQNIYLFLKKINTQEFTNEELNIFIQNFNKFAKLLTNYVYSICPKYYLRSVTDELLIEMTSDKCVLLHLVLEQVNLCKK